MSARTCHRCGYFHEVDTTSGCPVPTQNTLTQPFACPICHGKGRVASGFYGAIGVDSWSVSDMTPEACRSCNTTGVVWR